LQSRLQRRLLHRGIRITRVLEEEHCRIPMGLPLPRRDQRLLAFGAAAGKVHPATGYQVARSLAEAPALADAIANGLDHGPARASELGWQTLWPREALVQWELYSFGTRFLCTLGAAETRAFFDAFFDLETPMWHGYLSGTLGVAGLAQAMCAVFSNLSPPLRWELMRTGARTAPLPVLRAALAH
jgi:lycopene cyclase-like protein